MSPRARATPGAGAASTYIAGVWQFCIAGVWQFWRSWMGNACEFAQTAVTPAERGFSARTALAFEGTDLAPCYEPRLLG